MTAGAYAPTLLDCRVELPALAFGGEKDMLVTVGQTQRLVSDYFPKGRCIIHDKGHCVPARLEHTDAIIDFLEEHCAILCREKEGKSDISAAEPFEISEDVEDELGSPWLMIRLTLS